MIGRYLIAYAGAAAAFLSLDAVWLTLAGPRLYAPALHAVLADAPRPIPAVLFYGIYLIGLVIFAVRPALAAGRWRMAALTGAAFGFFAYATYDLTNQATLKVWETRITLMDLAWGAAVSAAGATAGYLAAARLGRKG